MAGRRYARSGAVAIAASAGALAAWAAWFEPRMLRVREIELELPRWPEELDGLRVALVSDLHVGSPHVGPRRLDRVVDAVLAARPDLIVLAGDFVDTHSAAARRVPPADVAARLSRLHAPVGVWAVLGNHDWDAEGAAMPAALRARGIPVLEERAAAIHARGVRFWIAGVGDAQTRDPDVAAALADVPRNEPVLLVSHDPDVFPYVPARVALTLSGHTHGGQVDLPLIRARVIPSRHGDRFKDGHIVEDGRHLYVSRGIGTSRYPVRFMAPPEVPVLSLRAPRPPAPD